MAPVTRRSSGQMIKFIGTVITDFRASKLPTNRDVYLHFRNYLLAPNVVKERVAFYTAKSLIEIWKRAGIPTKSANGIKKMIMKLAMFTHYICISHRE